MAVRAVIFDCFGVLVENSFDTFLDTYIKDEQKKEVAREADHLST